MVAHPWHVPHSGLTTQVSPADMSLFMSVCPEVRYTPGSAVFRIGDPAENLHVITKGQVKLVVGTPRGQERILSVCGPDDLIGEAFVRDQDRYRVDAIALEEVTTCPMSRAQFAQLAERSPSFAVTFAGVLATNLFHCRDQLAQAYDPIRVRVAKLLMEQARRFGVPDGDGWYRLSTRLRHEEIASIVSATRVSVTMTLTEFREMGLVQGTRGRYRLRLDGLAVVAEDA
ncbi:MAG: Crp/Fnr family transcriptional regulator [Trueperaceae bacterium]|nr:Crp/Fnr family transcriptional regulator [Trueperaceae bacterium]